MGIYVQCVNVSQKKVRTKDLSVSDFEFALKEFHSALKKVLEITTNCTKPRFALKEDSQNKVKLYLDDPNLDIMSV